MKKHSLITFLILVYTGFTFSQEIKEVVFKDGYNYIPVSYITDSTTKGLLFSYLMKEDEGIIRENNEKSLEIFWHSACTDGTYSLIITPEQIYFTDGHENPNPNILYWILPIDSLIYQQILFGFRKNRMENIYFDSSYNEEILFSEEEEYNFDYCDTLLEQQMNKCFSLLNSFILDKTKKLDRAKCIIPKNLIRHSFLEEELKSWRIYKNERNK